MGVGTGPAIALAHGARVVDVSHRQIAPTRNSGAAAARGERLVFVDADTVVPPACSWPGSCAGRAW